MKVPLSLCLQALCQPRAVHDQPGSATFAHQLRVFPGGAHDRSCYARIYLVRLPVVTKSAALRARRLTRASVAQARCPSTGALALHSLTDVHDAAPSATAPER